MTHVLPAVIPSPTEGVWHLGPLPLRAYALCILLGIVVAIWLGRAALGRPRRPAPATVLDVAAYAVPAGIVGGRLYHVITSPQAYFGENGDPVSALYIWEGGLGIWGAVALGGVGAWIGCRRLGIKLPPFADAIAPGIVLAQAIGRFGNWFNNELYGRATDLPWGLRIYDWDAAAGRAERRRRRRAGRPRDVPPGLRVRGDLERRHRGRADLGGPALEARPRPGVRPVCRALHRGTRLDRSLAYRSREPHPWATPQPVDVRRPASWAGWPTW